MPKVSSLDMKAAPGMAVTVCLPALIRSGSTCKESAIKTGGQMITIFGDFHQFSAKKLEFLWKPIL
jgi:hypothetical protein